MTHRHRVSVESGKAARRLPSRMIAPAIRNVSAAAASDVFRRLGALLMALVLCAGLAPLQTATAAVSSDMAYASTGADGGMDAFYRDAAPITVTLEQSPDPHLLILAGTALDRQTNTGFSLRLYPPVGTPLTTGLYPLAQAEVGIPTGGSPDHPRIGSDDHACLQDEPAWFRIDELEMSGATVTKLAATAVCEGVQPYVQPRSLEIRYHSTLPMAPVKTITRQIRFPRTLVGTPSDGLAVTLTALGGQPLHPQAAVLAGASAADFEIVDDGCAAMELAAGAMCTVVVRMVPVDGSALTRYAYLDIADDSIVGFGRTFISGTVTRPTSLTITSSANPATLPAGPEFTAHVSPDPTYGSVEWSVDGVPAVTQAGGFSLNLNSLFGEHTVTARYLGYEGYAPSGPSNTITQVTYVGSKVTPSVSPAYSGVAGAVDLSGTVTLAQSAAAVVSGTVTITDETTGIVLGSGDVTYTSPWFTVPSVVLSGLHQIRVDYSGAPPWISPSSAPLTIEGLAGVDSLAATHFFVGGMASVSKGAVPGVVTITALDSHGRIDKAYEGTVRLTSNDPAASLPAAYTFTPGDAGSHLFPVTLGTAGHRDVTATDVNDSAVTGSAGTEVAVREATYVASAVAVSDDLACAVVDDATVRCWGRNQFGQAGDGTTVDRRLPVAVVGVAGAVAVTAGSEHACALLSDHTIRCWGRNDIGELGDGTLENRSEPVTVLGIDTAVSIDAEYGHTCALLAGGSVRCWGYGLIPSHASINPIPIDVPEFATATAITVGGPICAVLADTTVRCWSSNSVGELGNGTFTESATPVTVPGVTGAIGIAAGMNHVCVLLADHGVTCWGDGRDGQVGTGVLDAVPTPARVPGLSGVAAITAAGATTCAVLEDATTRCWGSNTVGNFGDGTWVSHGSPVAGGAVNVAQFALGAGTACEITTDHQLRCWGRNLYGELGDGRIDQLTPVQALPLPPVTGFAAMADATCALLAGGTVDCWGAAGHGQTGNGVGIQVQTPTSVAGLADVAQVSGSSDFACARLMDKTIRCWGQGMTGQLGDGAKHDGAPPLQVSGITTAVDVSAGYGRACAVLEDGTVWCWGATDKYGWVLSLSPTQVIGIADAVEVEAGSGFACARLADGTARCWGANGAGQLGSGTWTDSATPVVVADLTNATSLAAQAASMCALRADKTMGCWGLGTSGQLGNGSVYNSSKIAAVKGLTDVTAITGGSTHACARRQDSTVMCWGANSNGQLGDGTALLRSTPVTVAGLSAAVIEGGGSHTCAVSMLGPVMCWGADATGQTGIGRHPFSPLPVDVDLAGAPGFRISLDAPAVTGTLRVPIAIGTLPGSATPTKYFVSLSPAKPQPWDLGWNTDWSTTPPASIVLPPGDSLRTIYAWARSDAGEMSPVATATVRTDTTAPTASLTIPSAVRTRVVPVTAAAADTSGIDKWLLSAVPSNPSAADLRWSAIKPTSISVSAGDGSKRLYLWARDLGGNVSVAAAATVKLDTLAPTGGGAPTAVAAAGSARTVMPLAIAWAAARDAASGPVRYQLAYRAYGTSSWTSVSLSSPATASTAVALAPGTYRFRVRALDQAGNAGVWRESGWKVVARVQESSTAVRLGPAFRRVTLVGASGGAVAKATRPGSASFTVWARSVAWVSTLGPDCGIASVWVDGHRVAIVDLYSAAVVPAKIVWRGTWSSARTHVIKIVVTGTHRAASTGARVDVDSFVWTR